MELKRRVDLVTSRRDFIEFVDALREDLATNPATWHNSSLGDYLEALSAWAEDMDGYYCGNSLPAPTTPSWKTIAEMLLAAKVYE